MNSFNNLTQYKLTELFLSKPMKEAIAEYDQRYELGDTRDSHPEFDGITFRIHKSALGNINIAYGKVYKNIQFFKPIGFYELDLGEFSCTLLKEFEPYIHNILSDSNNTVSINRLTLQQQALIGAFSAEAFEEAKLYRDTTFFVNGLNFEIYMNCLSPSYPQSFLDDIYGLASNIPLAYYNIKDTNSPSIATSLPYENEYNKLNDMDLYSYRHIIKFL